MAQLGSSDRDKARFRSYIKGKGARFLVKIFA